MAMALRTKFVQPSNPPLSDRESAMAKAIADGVRAEYKRAAGEVVDSRLKDIENGIAALVGRVMEKEFSTRISVLVKHYEERIADIESAHAKALDSIYALVKSLPVPQVEFSVPQGAIKAEVNLSEKSFDVHVDNRVKAEVDLSAKSFDLKMPAPIVNNKINVPKAEKPNVTVNVPELKLPEVTVNVPKADVPNIVLPKRKTKTTKSIVYGATGRPERIEEETEEG